jgi:hypothetical protein
MSCFLKPVAALFALGFFLPVANAQNVREVAIKNGETLELGALYSVRNCRSILKSPPVVEIMNGPPQVTVSVKEAMVLPRAQQCAKEVKGGILTITAKDVTEPMRARMTIRIRYPSGDGDHPRSRTLDLAMFP